MKKLLLIRHAKATHESGYADFERPLKYQGLEDAALMAERVNHEESKPQILLASPALRTLSTANVFAEHLLLPQPLTDKKIYDASLETLLDVVNELPDEYDFIGLVGHNPGITQLLYYLTGDMKEMAPCAIVSIEFAVAAWVDVNEYSGKLIYFESPGN